MVLETSAFGEDGAEDAPDAGGVERSGIALDNRIEDGGFARFIGDRQGVLTLEARNLGDGLSAAVDEAQEFEIELVDGGALLGQGRIHHCLLENTKAAICGIAAG
jgi:hypothetical protein